MRNIAAIVRSNGMESEASKGQPDGKPYDATNEERLHGPFAPTNRLRQARRILSAVRFCLQQHPTSSEQFSDGWRLPPKFAAPLQLGEFLTQRMKPALATSRWAPPPAQPRGFPHLSSIPP